MNLFSVQVHKPNCQLLGSCEELTGDRTNRVYTDYDKVLLKLNLTEKLREWLCFMWVVWPGFWMQRWDGFYVTIPLWSKLKNFFFQVSSPFCVAQMVPLQYLVHLPDPLADEPSANSIKVFWMVFSSIFNCFYF